jgi:glycogen debranching enzyme
MSYHNGSVWPHDNAIAVAGLVRYGFIAEAHRVVLGLLDAAAELGGRLPELFAGVSRSEIATPVSYPTSCSPQAWASATPLSFLRSLLRLDPWVPHGMLWAAPELPVAIGDLVVADIPLGDRRVRIAAGAGGVEVTGLGDTLEMVSEPRLPLAAGAR